MSILKIMPMKTKNIPSSGGQSWFPYPWVLRDQAWWWKNHQLKVPKHTAHHHIHCAWNELVLGMNCHLVGNQVSRVETHTELISHGDVSFGREGFHQSFSSRLGNNTQVVNQISLGHANTAKEKQNSQIRVQIGGTEILNLRLHENERTVILVGDNLDFKILAAVQLSQVFITDLVFLFTESPACRMAPAKYWQVGRDFAARWRVFNRYNRFYISIIDCMFWGDHDESSSDLNNYW